MSKEITVRQILVQWLGDNGYDGLAGVYCGCELDDLMACDSLGPDCVAGHKVTCPCKYKTEDDVDRDGCEHEGNKGQWCIIAGKEQNNE